MTDQNVHCLEYVLAKEFSDWLLSQGQYTFDICDQNSAGVLRLWRGRRGISVVFMSESAIIWSNGCRTVYGCVVFPYADPNFCDKLRKTIDNILRPWWKHKLQQLIKHVKSRE